MQRGKAQAAHEVEHSITQFMFTLWIVLRNKEDGGYVLNPYGGRAVIQNEPPASAR